MSEPRQGPSFRQRYGAPLAFAAGGLLFLSIGVGMGGSAFAYERWGASARGKVTQSSSTGTRYVRFEFKDPGGELHSGQSSGYGGTPGESISIEYLSVFPAWSRVAGAGGEAKSEAKKWQWLVVFGACFAFVGAHWGWSIRGRARLRARLEQEGERVSGEVVRVQSKAVRYSFTTPAGDTVIGNTLGAEFEGLQELSAGAAVEVLFDPRESSQNVLVLEN